MSHIIYVGSITTRSFVFFSCTVLSARGWTWHGDVTKRLYLVVGFFLTLCYFKFVISVDGASPFKCTATTIICRRCKYCVWNRICIVFRYVQTRSYKSKVWPVDNTVAYAWTGPVFILFVAVNPTDLIKYNALSVLHTSMSASPIPDTISAPANICMHILLSSGLTASFRQVNVASLLQQLFFNFACGSHRHVQLIYSRELRVSLHVCAVVLMVGLQAYAKCKWFLCRSNLVSLRRNFSFRNLVMCLYAAATRLAGRQLYDASEFFWLLVAVLRQLQLNWQANNLLML